MAGSRNNVHFAEGFRLQDTLAIKYPIMQKEVTDVGYINNPGNPENVVTANMGSICNDRTNGDLYVKNSGSGNTGWLLLASGTTVPTSFLGDVGVAVPAANTITLAGGTGIDTSAAGSTVTFAFDVTEVPTVVTTVNSDSGTATGASNAVSIVGGTAIDTSAAGDTITIAFDITEAGTIATTYTADAGSATPAANNLNILGTGTVSTSGAGSTITINGGAGGVFAWNEVTGTSDTMVVNNGYVSSNAALVTLTLPATAAFGENIRVTGKGAGGWRIAQNAGQTIHFGILNTTTGAGGRLDSTNRYDGIELLCITANTDFVALSSIGNVLVT